MEDMQRVGWEDASDRGEMEADDPLWWALTVASRKMNKNKIYQFKIWGLSIDYFSNGQHGATPSYTKKSVNKSTRKRL